MNHISLQPFKQSHLPFLEKLYYSTREEELSRTNWSEQQKQQFALMQFLAQKTGYEKKFPNGLEQIIYFKKIPIGRLYINETENSIHIIDISLLPQYQNKGIGTFLLHQLINTARRSHRSITLQVIKTNHAKNLYARAGFVTISNDGARDYMECR